MNNRDKPNPGIDLFTLSDVFKIVLICHYTFYTFTQNNSDIKTMGNREKYVHI